MHCVIICLHFFHSFSTLEQCSSSNFFLYMLSTEVFKMAKVEELSRRSFVKNFFCVILFALLITNAANSSAANIQALLPRPDFEPGWKWDFEPETYTAENLYEYIDGEAELYNDYHFVTMATASYALKTDESVTFTVDVYDMGTPLNAFGIYSSYRRPELAFEKIGEEAIVSDLNIRFYQGKYFVQLNAGSTNPRVKNTIHNLALKLAATFPIAPQPQELSLLPGENQVPHSLKYITKGFMGQSAFGPVMQASYQSGFAAFVVINKSDKESKAALKTFRESIAKRGKIINSSENTSLKFSAKTPYQGNIVTQVFKNYILGISGYKDQQKADRMLKKIKTGL